MARSDETLGFDRVAERELNYVFERGRFPPTDASPASQESAAEAFARVWSEVRPQPPAEPGTPHAGEGAVRRATTHPEIRVLEGLALSGGGIRSACFSLGVLEGLAAHGLLSKFHFISSVSGGGYIAGWLAAWSYRHARGIEGVEDELKSAPAQHMAPPELQHLSRYATYLAPKLGPLTADVWSLLTAYMRNLVVTLAISLPVLLLLCTVPYIVVLLLSHYQSPRWLVHLTGWATAITLMGTGLVMRFLGDQRHFLGFKTSITDGFAWLATLAGGLLFAATSRFGGIREWLKLAEVQIGSPRLTFGVGAFVLFAFTLLVLQRASPTFILWRESPPRPVDLKVLVWRIVRSVWHCSVFALSALLAVVVLAALEPLARHAYPGGDVALAGRQIFLISTLAPLQWAVALLISQAFLHAVLSQVLNDSDREWMSRFIGICMIAAICWAALCGVSYWLPMTLSTWGPYWLLGASAALLVVFGIARERMRAAATFLAGTLAFAAVGLIVFGRMGPRIVDGPDMARTAHDLLLWGSILVAWTLSLDWFVNVNRFSMHALYRDRLVRTFLGASRTRPSPTEGTTAGPPRTRPDEERRQFTVRQAENFHRFDPDDNPKLKCLRSTPADGPGHWMPIFLFNAALNRTWGAVEPGRSIKAHAFVFSPFACGSPQTGYCETAHFGAPDGGVSLGTAIATSGAALSSRRGRYDSRLSAFFLTLVNLRLGWWLGNPNNAGTRGRHAPRFSLQAYLSELLGHTVTKRKWIHLSDGGHHENLGAIELMRRGCRRIVVVDGTQDPHRHFDDMANLVRLAREELNVAIDPASPNLIGGRELGSKGRYAALFRVQYPQGQVGRLLYIKPCFYPGASEVPIDVQNYALGHPSFPHEPTIDQFFSAAQFDAYRRLGRHQVQTLMADLTNAECDIRDLFTRASEHINRR